MAEFPEVGRCCALTGCTLLDFLPFVCERCEATFCKNHRMPAAHGCPRPSGPESPPPPAGDGVEWKEAISARGDKFLCAFAGCFQREYTRFVCSLCATIFCIKHRQCEDHECKGLKPRVTAAAPSKTTIENEEKGGPSNKFSKKLPNPFLQARADRVAQMRARMAAGGQNKIPAADQLFVFVTAATETGEMRAPLLVAKSWPVARLADLVRRELGLAPGERFKLEKSNGGEKALIFSSSSSSFCAGGPSLGTLLGEGEELDVVVLDA